MHLWWGQDGGRASVWLAKLGGSPDARAAVVGVIPLPLGELMGESGAMERGGEGADVKASS